MTVNDYAMPTFGKPFLDKSVEQSPLRPETVKQEVETLV